MLKFLLILILVATYVTIGHHVTKRIGFFWGYFGIPAVGVYWLLQG